MPTTLPTVMKPPKVTQQDTIHELLTRSKRTTVPLRKTFLQQGIGRVRSPGPLAELCRRQDERALDLYLLVHAAASAHPYDVVLPAAVWARAIGLSRTASARSAVSKALRRLEDLHLIARSRAGNRSRVALLDEGGHDETYTHPSEGGERYLKLPYDYWEAGWYLQLGLPAKVALLIALSLSDAFPLPAERARGWYGVSPDTIQRGLSELEGHGLLDVDRHYKRAPLSETGWTTEHRYTLQAPFGPQRRSGATVTQLHA